ncbi:hypothetical protein PZB75_27095 [Streptomyces sp. AM 4-1-1]|uniref:hypothetical protein n=1 Tax=Streptomyces sp. AM 4-1-1 TaxID=3028710 RepID=UPI0023B8C852|nr:hypothetical protein [Streptomyces sp. AM 4-1-1]WEH36695.1 hypothetical protein PZB75_27095 [Streptomyces sp. AM 4-1-1]
MLAVIVWWNLEESGQTIESLREFLRAEAVDRFSHVTGLRLKFWISDQDTNRWGAVLLWESVEAAAAPIPGRAAELIGYPPSHHFSFTIEATTEGIYSLARLSGRGVAVEN